MLAVTAGMCGRYTIKTDRRKLAGHFDVEPLPELLPRYNLGPTQDGLVLRVGDRPGKRTAALLRWGLIPSWMKEGMSTPLLINARAETVASKPAFRDAIKRRRCLVVADGFFEWSRRGAVRQPYYFTVNQGEPFAMAGLWERWRPPDGARDDVIESYAIITTTANETLAPIHDRMPVILEPDFYDDWLNPLVNDADVLRPLLRSYPAVRMFARAVSSRVNNIKHDDPACLEPPDEGEAHAGRATSPPPSSAAGKRASAGQLDLDL